MRRIAADGTKVEYEEFLPDFFFATEGKPDTDRANTTIRPRCLGVTPPGGERIRVFAFAGLPRKIPVGAPKAGYKWHLANMRSRHLAHVLSIKYDPFNGAFIAWYFGGFGLIGGSFSCSRSLIKRVWAVVRADPFGKFNVTLGGDTNRNHAAFEERFCRRWMKIDDKASRLTEGDGDV